MVIYGLNVVLRAQDYQFGYDVAGYDAYGNPNVHGRTEAREGNTVKGQYRVSKVVNLTMLMSFRSTERGIVRGLGR